MRGRWLLAKWGLVLGSGIAFAQPPSFPPAPPVYPGVNPPGSPNPPGPVAPTFPPLPQPPGQLPPLRPVGSAMPLAPTNPGVYPPGAYPPGAYPPGVPNPNSVAHPLEISLPQKENKLTINVSDVNVKRIAGSWQLWAGQKMLRDFGNSDKSETAARDAARVFRDLRPTEWVTIGGPKPIVEYGLVNGRTPMAAGIPGSGPADTNGVFRAGGINDGPLVTGAGASAIVPIDLKTVRVEAIRGVWCLRDDSNLHFNFGSNKADAEQTLAAVQHYGFNRVGVVGSPTPVLHYLFAAPDSGAPPAKNPFVQVQLQAQIEGLTHVGIPVAGVGYVGEMIKFDPRKLDVRKEGTEWVIAAGSEVIGRYGQAEWVARDAARTIQDSRFNGFCKVGSAGMTFFLVDEKTPTRVPFNAQGRRFDLNALKVQKVNGRWAVTENSRHLIDCASPEEGETLIRVLKSFQFDELCHLGPTPKLGVSFFAKGGR